MEGRGYGGPARYPCARWISEGLSHSRAPCLSRPNILVKSPIVGDPFFEAIASDASGHNTGKNHYW